MGLDVILTEPKPGHFSVDYKSESSLGAGSQHIASFHSKSLCLGSLLKAYEQARSAGYEQAERHGSEFFDKTRGLLGELYLRKVGQKQEFGLSQEQALRPRISALGPDATWEDCRKQFNLLIEENANERAQYDAKNPQRFEDFCDSLG